MTTQREAFLAWIDFYMRPACTTAEGETALAAMGTILGMAQNHPPAGASDGSFDARSFELARDWMQAERDLGSALERTEQLVHQLRHYVPVPARPVTGAANYFDDDIPF